MGWGQRRTRSILVLIGVLTLVLDVTAAEGAGAGAGRDEALVRVLSPGNHQGVFAHGVPIVLRVRQGAKVRVTVNRRDVTRSLHLKGGHTRRGRIPQRLLRRVPRLVTVSARAGRRTDADVLVLRAVSRRKSFLDLSLHRTGPGPAPIEARFRTPVHRLWLTATLNGRRIERAAVAPQLGRRRILLTRTQGLRYGATS